MPQATLTSKGQTTIPKAIRDHLNLKPGDRLDFTLSGDKVVLTARNKRLADLAGLLGPPPRGAGSTIEEMDRAVAEAVARHVLGEDVDDSEDAA